MNLNRNDKLNFKIANASKIIDLNSLKQHIFFKNDWKIEKVYL